MERREKNATAENVEKLTEEELSYHRQVRAGEWVDVPKGFVAAPGTYVDSQGVLRSSSNHSIVVWHNGKKGRPPCDFRVLRPDQIVYVDNGLGDKAPWCPRCAEYNRLSALLGPNPGISSKEN